MRIANGSQSGYDERFGTGAAGGPESPEAQPGRGRKRRIGGRLSLFIGIVMLVAGLALVLYPTVTAVSAQNDVNEALAAWRSGAVDGENNADAAGESEAEATEGADAESAADDEPEFRSKEGDATYEKLVAYNERVREGEGGKVNDPFAFSDDSLAELGLPDGIIGSISVPKMGVTIPLYLGATEANMVDGAGIVAGTSMPLGEETSNTVIAAHRGGYFGLPMFRDIEDLEAGDTVTITTPWDKLTYAVREVKVVAPNDTEAVGVQEGSDLVTLLTCHPYGTNQSRMLVFCERVPNEEAQEDAGPVAAAVKQILPGNAGDSPLLMIENALKLAGLVILLFLGVYLVVDSVRRMRRRRADRKWAAAVGRAEAARASAPVGQAAAPAPNNVAEKNDARAVNSEKRATLPESDPGDSARSGRHFR